ncbi:MAG: hypothetical protein AAGA60_30360 [Cyanobacteria bacterium P01_E01_bin.42]
MGWNDLDYEGASDRGGFIAQSYDMEKGADTTRDRPRTPVYGN